MMLTSERNQGESDRYTFPRSALRILCPTEKGCWELRKLSYDEPRALLACSGGGS